MTGRRRTSRRLRRLGATTLQVAPAVAVLVALSHDFDGFAFLLMLGIFTALATALAAVLSLRERRARRRVPAIGVRTFT